MAAELPRCVVCRVGIVPGENVVFRSDTRVQHVSCPEVICPVCAGPIRPGQPIRRDADALVHSNCWMRRARRDERAAVAGGADVATVIRARLADGTLPRLPATKVWGGKGNGGACLACGEALREGAEYEAEFGGMVTVLFHRVCYEIWNEERMKPRAIGGGSAASPWTLFFDLGIARRASRDRAAYDEVRAATAETFCTIRAMRERSRAVRARTATVRRRN